MIRWKIKKIMLKQLGKRGFRLLSEDNIKESDARWTQGKKKKETL